MTDRIIPDRIKVMITSNGVSLDVTNDIVEWDSLEILQERDGVSGVITSVSFPVKLRGQSMDFIKTLFDNHGLYSTGILTIYERADYGNEYTLLKSAPLDFSTYNEALEYISIECAESELSDIINSEGKTKYDILVSTVKEDKQWKYDRMQLKNIGIYTLPENTPSSITRMDIGWLQLPISLNKANQAPGTSEVDFKSQPFGTNIKEYFVKSTKNTIKMYYDVDFEININVKVSAGTGDPTDFLNSSLFVLGVFYNSSDSNWKQLFGIGMTPTSDIIKENDITYSRSFSANLSGIYNYDLNIGEYASLMISFPPTPGFGWYIEVTLEITSSNKFEAYYYEASKDSVNIDVISPDKLLQEYLNQMGGEDKFTGIIEWEEEDYMTMIVAAESIRGFGNKDNTEAPDKAYIHGSPNDFIEWLKVLGYEPVIEGSTITFKTRDKVFTPDVTAIEMGDDDVADLLKQVDATHAYTSVEIGYDKQDYENENGRYEANGTFAYTTGYINRDDNKLSLISPYRADPMGIEFLCQERDNYTTDDKSDNDIFFVAIIDNTDYYTEYKGIVIDTDSQRIKMFNAPFNPYYLVKRNESLIGINAKQLKFKSTDMSREASIDDIDIYSDITITKKLFSPIIYNFAAGHHHDMPTINKNGLVNISWQNNVLRGYIRSIRKNYITEEETTWELHAYLE